MRRGSKQQRQIQNPGPEQHVLKTSMATPAAFTSSEQVGQMKPSTPPSPMYTTGPMTEPQMRVLRSANRFLSINVPRKILKSTTYKGVQEHVGDGLVGAIWYGEIQLVVEYRSTNKRDMALQTIRSINSDKEIGQPIGPGEPKLYMSWVVNVHWRAKPADLPKALHRHFQGSGYSSPFSYGLFDSTTKNIKKPLRIIFHQAPPLVNKRFDIPGWCKTPRREVITGSQFPLQIAQSTIEEGSTVTTDEEDLDTGVEEDTPSEAIKDSVENEESAASGSSDDDDPESSGGEAESSDSEDDESSPSGRAEGNTTPCLVSTGKSVAITSKLPFATTTRAPFVIKQREDPLPLAPNSKSQKVRPSNIPFFFTCPELY